MTAKAKKMGRPATLKDGTRVSLSLSQRDLRKLEALRRMHKLPSQSATLRWMLDNVNTTKK